VTHPEDETASVGVEVAVVDAPTGDASPDVVVVDTGSSSPGVDGDVAAVLAALSATVGAHDERLATLEARTATAEVTAEVAAGTADAALAEVDRVATETEEAVATVAEEAEAATAEVVEEVEDIAPDREHGWFKKRRLLPAGES